MKTSFICSKNLIEIPDCVLNTKYFNAVSLFYDAQVYRKRIKCSMCHNEGGVVKLSIGSKIRENGFIGSSNA